MLEKRGFFDSPFDFNGDGKVDMTERFVAYKIFETCIEDNKSDISTSSVANPGSNSSGADIFGDDPDFSDGSDFDI